MISIKDSENQATHHVSTLDCRVDFPTGESETILRIEA